jgi:rod shape-determining protein MreC
MIIALVHFGQRRPLFEEASYFEKFLLDTFAPIQQMISNSRRVVRDYFDNYLQNARASEENAFLKKQVSELQESLLNMREFQFENERLKKILNFGEQLEGKKILAQVVAWDSSSDHRVLRVNRGRLHGVELKSPVFTADGVVGYVYRMTDHYSDILTVLDTGHRVDVIVEKSRAHGILEGLSQNRTSLKYLPLTKPVTLDEKVVTSGVGRLYPKNILIGRVVKVERESYDLTQRIEVIPSVDFSNLEEVIIFVSDTALQDQTEWNELDSDQEAQ